MEKEIETINKQNEVINQYFKREVSNDSERKFKNKENVFLDYYLK